jgi:hypothetical protein
MAVAKFCPECGTPTEGAKFCPECGTSTARGARPEESAVNTEHTSTSTVAEDEREVWRGRPDPVLSPMAARTNTYVVTNERVKVDSGTLRKRAESMELFRVKDVSVKRSLTQRSRGRGDLVITSTDPSTPVFTFESIENPNDVAETLRGLVREARRRSGVVTQERM